MKIRTIAAALAVAATLTVTAAASDGRRGEERHHLDRDDHDRERERRGAARVSDADPVYLKECGACHLAFPPSMLPAASWRRMLGELDRHFGQNAELDAAARTRLEGWLAGQAGRPGPEATGAPQRITGLPWFADEHREVAGAAARPAVRSLANCAACHGGASRWEFEEDRVRIPR